jgi:hypothetical protein
MVTTLPRVHVVITGIEKMVPTLEDFATLMRLLPRSATGQAISNYVSLLTGTRGAGDLGTAPKRPSSSWSTTAVPGGFLDHGAAQSGLWRSAGAETDRPATSSPLSSRTGGGNAAQAGLDFLVVEGDAVAAGAVDLAFQGGEGGQRGRRKPGRPVRLAYSRSFCGPSSAR